MLLRFAYLKLQRPNTQTYYTPVSAMTTFVEGASSKIDPMGGTGVDAPSTLITDGAGVRYFVNKAFSTVNAAITAVTSTDQNISLL